MISDFMNTISKLNSVKKTETLMPIIQQRVNMTPLVVGDDLALKTSITSPVYYDRDLSKLLFKHIETSDDTYYQNFNGFCARTSNIDKLCLIWALFKSTYESMGKRKFFCDSDGDCSFKKDGFEEEIMVQELIHDDTFTIWDHEKPFHEFRHQIDVPYGNVNYSFLTTLPSIQDNNRMLSTMSTDVLQNNLDKLGTVYSKPQQLSLFVKAIRISPKDANSGIETVETTDLQEIVMAFMSYVPLDISDKLMDDYDKYFQNYLPKFYAKKKCPGCEKEVVSNINMETELFRRSVLG